MRSLILKLIPQFLRRPLAGIRDRVFREDSESDVLHRLAEQLPSGHYVQRMRSLELRGIPDDHLRAIVDDYRAFSYENYKYGAELDPIRIPGGIIEAVMMSNDIPGELAECGVYQGSTAKMIRNIADVDKKLHLFDTFEGFTEDDRAMEVEKGMGRDPGPELKQTSLERAKNRVFSDFPHSGRRFSDDSVIFHQGPVDETLDGVGDTSFSFVHLDMDLYEPMRFAMEFFIPRMSEQGVLMIHDFAVPGSGYKGVYNAYESVDTESLTGPLPFGDHSTALFIKKSPKQ